ncbi:hypothetical protein D7V80_18000 [Corallococcus sp. CA054B]|uniref:cysteine peptidase family C39 domain-containing protein n=1 Tax=Corallococcus sp. CA054B TaxID=2316734 RepID=UPI000EA0AB06|nr:hypothetical protein D7V80_18000 [Corallococcus sp. CA054B]
MEQETKMGCGPACARQLLKERGVEVSETDLRDASNFSPEMGTDAPGLARAMNKYEPDSGTQWVAKPVHPDELEQQSYPYIAFMRGSYGPAHGDRPTSGPLLGRPEAQEAARKEGVSEPGAGG